MKSFGNNQSTDVNLLLQSLWFDLLQDTFICHTITQSFAMGSISPRDFIDLVYIKHYEGNMDIISCKLKHFVHILELLWVINKFSPKF